MPKFGWLYTTKMNRDQGAVHLFCLDEETNQYSIYVEWGAVHQNELDDRPWLVIRDLRAIP